MAVTVLFVLAGLATAAAAATLAAALAAAAATAAVVADGVGVVVVDGVAAAVAFLPVLAGDAVGALLFAAVFAGGVLVGKPPLPAPRGKKNFLVIVGPPPGVLTDVPPCGGDGAVND